MTTRLPKAQRLADLLEEAVQIYAQRSEDDPGGYVSEVDQAMDEAAAELRRLHFYCQELEAQVIRDCMTRRRDYDPGPQAETIEEAARDVGKWLNERPNRPLDLRHVAMLAHHAQRTQQPTPSGEAEANRVGLIDDYAEAREPLQVFDSPHAKALMRAFEEGWAACRDAEFVGEDAQNDAFNQSATVNVCMAEDWTAAVRASRASADSVLEDAARLLESQHTWLTNVAAANLVRSLAARIQVAQCVNLRSGEVISVVKTQQLEESH